MRILIADDDLTLSAGIARNLAAAGHSVEVVAGGKRAIARAIEEPVDVLIVDWLLADLDGLAVVRHLREKGGCRPAILMLSPLTQVEARDYALKSGVDEYLTKPTTVAALFAGLQAATIAAAQSRSLTNLRPSDLRLVTTPLWMSLGTQITGHLRGCTGILKLESRRAEPLYGDQEISASLGMLDSEQQVEFDISLACSRTSGARLAHAMVQIDDADDATIREILSELCNNILGFAKASLRGHGFAFTLSVPEGEDGDDGEDTAKFSASTNATIEGAGVRLWVEARIRPPTSCIVKLGELKENMVLLEDVKNDAGALLLPAGTRITAAAAQRMAHHGLHREVRVAPL